MGSAEAVRVPAGSTLRGEIDVEGDLVVAGRLEGSVRVSGALLVEAGGSVVAPLRADRVVIGGSVRGDVSASGSIRLLGGCRVEGDLRAPKLVTEEGAVVRGRVELGDGLASDDPRDALPGSAPRRRGHLPLPDAEASRVDGQVAKNEPVPNQTSSGHVPAAGREGPPPMPKSALALGVRRKRIIFPPAE
ncbi:MAG TPA: polymer-forming cytoskeletal protein [Vulgatibacter sp.]